MKLPLGVRKDINSHCAAEIFIATAQSGILRAVVEGILSEQLDAAHPHDIQIFVERNSSFLMDMEATQDSLAHLS